MNNRQYYSIRTGKNPYALIDLTLLRRFFYDAFNYFDNKDYFQEAFGYECVDSGYVVGTLGYDINAQILRKLYKENLWPISDNIANYEEDDIFDMMEFLYDYTSMPVDEFGYYHRYNDCGWHYSEFDQESGKQEFRDELNSFLCNYNDGFELSEKGEVFLKGDPGLNELFNAQIPTDDDSNVKQRINTAIEKFRRSRSSFSDRSDAIRDLADVFEYIKPKVKEVLAEKDTGAIFNIANNFGIRHHNDKQKTQYDQSIWYSWMFHYYLATIHAVLRLTEKQKI